MFAARAGLVAALVLGAAAPLSAQSFRRITPQQATANAPRLMVANAFSTASSDSMQAIEFGTAMRRRMEKVVGDDYRIVSDSLMNAALTQYGYHANAILPTALQLQLAKQMQARAVVTSTISRQEGGRHLASARFAAPNDEAGVIVTQSQIAGQSLNELGAKVADAFKPAVEALPHARACVEARQQQKFDKAIDEANKALKSVPTHGLANYCLAQIRAEQKAPARDVVSLLETAARGDSLSLPILSQLVQKYDSLGDSSKVIAGLSQMLRASPRNQKLREEAFRSFLRYNKPLAARQVADEGLAEDPYNADLYDLKSNACLFAEDFKCAVDALEQEFAIDSTKADTLFFIKITEAAARQPDTTRLIKWSRVGAAKYPESVPLLENLNKGYVLSGQVDSAVAVTRRLTALDSTQVLPALAAVQQLAGAKRLKEAASLIDFVQRKGDQTQKDQLGAILVNGALPLLSDPKDLAGAVALSRQAVSIATPGSKLHTSANYVLGLAAFLRAAEIDPQTEASKSCEQAKDEQTLLQDAEKGLTTGRATKPETADQYLGYIKQFQPRIASMLKAYCK